MEEDDINLNNPNIRRDKIAHDYGYGMFTTDFNRILREADKSLENTKSEDNISSINIANARGNVRIQSNGNNVKVSVNGKNYSSYTSSSYRGNSSKNSSDRKHSKTKEVSKIVKEKFSNMNPGNIKKFVTIGIVALVAFIVIMCSFSVVGPTDRGVILTFGKVGDSVVGSGLKIHAPFFQKVKKYSISPSELDISFGIAADGAVTSDMQTVGLDAAVFWKYDERMLVETATGYTDSSIKDLIRSSMLASVKEVIGQYTAQEIIESQTIVSEKVLEKMNTKLNDKPINITMVNISNYNWSADYDRMINETMQVKQAVKKAEQQLQVTELEAQQKVKQAEADTQALIVRAEADKQKAQIEAEAALIKAEKAAEAELIKAEKAAEAELVKAKKEAEARKVEAEAEAYYYEQLSQNLEVQRILKELDIETERAERWDGREIPNYIPLTVSGSPVVMTGK